MREPKHGDKVRLTEHGSVIYRLSRKLNGILDYPNAPATYATIRMENGANVSVHTIDFTFRVSGLDEYELAEKEAVKLTTPKDILDNDGKKVKVIFSGDPSAKEYIVVIESNPKRDLLSFMSNDVKLGGMSNHTNKNYQYSYGYYTDIPSSISEMFITFSSITLITEDYIPSRKDIETYIEHSLKKNFAIDEIKPKYSLKDDLELTDTQIDTFTKDLNDNFNTSITKHNTVEEYITTLETINK